jgi:hypothetical protein
MVYGSRLIFPKDLYLSKVSDLFASEMIDTKVTSRAPTGWLSDKATQCLSLGVGIVPEKNPGDIFLDSYTNPNLDYNPCQGLAIQSGYAATESQVSSYSRYWHGHAILTQWLVLLIGFPALINLLWLINLLLIFIIGNYFFKSKNYKFTRPITIALIFPYLVFSDLADLHTSITHTMVSILSLLTTYVFIVISEKKYSQIKFYAFILGSLYSFILFGLSPQNIPVILISWSGIFLLINGNSRNKVFSQLISFLYFWTIGYFLTFVSKWFFVEFFTNFPIFNDVKQQFLHRTSHSSSDLSSGVSVHLQFAESLPVFMQSWIANISTLIIHITDPRYASLPVQIVTALALIFIFCLPLAFLLMTSMQNRLNIKNFMLLNFASLLFLFGWYAILSQHSYDHATYTYRSLVFWLGGFFATLTYWFLLLRTQRCVQRDSTSKPYNLEQSGKSSLS